MTRAREVAAVAVLLCFQAAQLVHGLRTDGRTYDELLYIASGYRQLTLGDHRFGAEHPPIALLLGALPLAPLDLKVRDLNAADARGWNWAYDFANVDNDPIRILHRARVPVVIFSLLLSVALWRWSRAAHGAPAGIVALALSAFHPSLLAHGHLITTDMPGTFMMIAFSWALWRWTNAPTGARAGVVGVCLGLALATRLTALLMILIGLIVLVTWWLRSRRGRDEAKAVTQLVVGCLVLTPLIIWAAYGFRYEAWPGEPDPQIGAAIWRQAIEGTFGARVISLVRSAHLFPAAFLASLDAYLIKSTVGHQNYLLGQVSATGWWYYYVVAVIVKNTPGFLLAIVVMLAFARRGASAFLLHSLLPAALMFAAASFSRVQVGERYILPVYAYLILAIASVVPAVMRQKGGGALIAGIIALHAGPALMAWPGGYLPYFNALVGRDIAYSVLADSNLDWGQDLPRLAAWSKAHPDRRLQLAYWGTDDPANYGMEYEDLPGQPLYPVRHPAADPYRGWIAISPTLLSGLYAPPGTQEKYRELRRRTPDDFAGVFPIYHVEP